jgi:hypothetical protein
MALQARYRHWILDEMYQDSRLYDTDWEDHLWLLTSDLEQVRKVSIAFVLADFYCNGIDSYSLAIILGGWQAFSPPDGLYYAIITGFLGTYDSE